MFLFFPEVSNGVCWKSFSKCALFLMFALISFASPIVEAQSTARVAIYGKGCLSCFVEYSDALKAELKRIGIESVELYYIETDLDAAAQLEQIHQRLAVPENMRGSIVVNLNDTFLFEGSVPTRIITDFLMNRTQDYRSIVVFRDELHGTYRIMDDTGRVRECNIESSVADCSEDAGPPYLGSVLALVVVGGLLDGINPCAFAVLLFFIAVLFVTATNTSTQQAKRRILMIGSVYIIAVFLIYLAIGLAFIKIVAVSPFPHLFAKAGALLMILLGLINIKDYRWPGRGLSLGIPRSQWETVRRWMHKLTFPAAFVVGLMVGAFEFPCTGGIYVGVLGLLAVRSTFLEGLLYLIIYNLAFVLPLVIILVFACSRTVIRFSLVKWQEQGQRTMKLISGVIMVALGVILLLFEFV